MSDKDLEIAANRRSITLAEIGVIVALLCTFGSTTFTYGVFYGQVEVNTQRLDNLEPRVAEMEKSVNRIDANVAFLTQLAVEERAARHGQK